MIGWGYRRQKLVLPALYMVQCLEVFAALPWLEEIVRGICLKLFLHTKASYGHDGSIQVTGSRERVFHNLPSQGRICLEIFLEPAHKIQLLARLGFVGEKFRTTKCDILSKHHPNGRCSSRGDVIDRVFFARLRAL